MGNSLLSELQIPLDLPPTRLMPTGLTINSKAAEAPSALQTQPRPVHMLLLLPKMFFLWVFSWLPILVRDMET